MAWRVINARPLCFQFYPKKLASFQTHSLAHIFLLEGHPPRHTSAVAEKTLSSPEKINRIHHQIRIQFPVQKQSKSLPMKTNSKLRNLLTVAGSSLIAMSSASAADRFWDGGTTDIAGNGNGVSAGGSGTWDTTIRNWDAGASPYVAWNNANGDTARFGGTAGTVTVGSPVSAVGLTFSSGGYTITGGTITMTNATISASTGTTTIASVIDRTGNLTKSNGGTLSLTNTANNITGLVSVTGGVLEVTKMANAGQSSSIGTSATVSGNFTLNNNTTLRYIGSGDSTDRVARFGSAGSGNVTFDASGTGALNFTNTGVFAGNTSNGNHGCPVKLNSIS